MNTVYVFGISSSKFYICSLSIKRFHPYFELIYFLRGKAVCFSKLSFKMEARNFYSMVLGYNESVSFIMMN